MFCTLKVICWWNTESYPLFLSIRYKTRTKHHEFRSKVLNNWDFGSGFLSICSKLNNGSKFYARLEKAKKTLETELLTILRIWRLGSYFPGYKLYLKKHVLHRIHIFSFASKNNIFNNNKAQINKQPMKQSPQATNLSFLQLENLPKTVFSF